MNPSPSVSDPYNLNYTISIAAAKSGYFGGESDRSASDVFDEIDEESKELSRKSMNASSGSASDGGKQLSVEVYESTREEDGEQWEKEYQEILSEELAELKEVQKQAPPRSPNSVRTSASESSQASKLKQLKKRISHIFQPGHKNKADEHLLLLTSYSQHSGTSTDYTPSTSAYSQNTGNKEDSELQMNNDEGESDISIQRKRRFPFFARIASNHPKPGRKPFENAVRKSMAEDKIPETDSSSESDQTDFQQIMASDGNNIDMSKLSHRTYVIKDDSSSVALSAAHMSDKAANFCFPCDAICCFKHECDFSIYDDDSVDYTVDDDSESSDTVANAVHAIQKHAARLGISEHELIENVRRDR